MGRLSSKLRIGEKIGLSFGLVGLLFLGVIWHYHHSLQQVVADYERLHDVYQARKSLALGIEIQLAKIWQAENDFLTQRDEGFAAAVDTHAKALLETTSKLAEVDEESRHTAQQIRALTETYLNRFHDTEWAAAEPRCTRNLMAEINPRLTLDLHEHGGNAFWFSARHQRNDDDEKWERRMADEIIKAVTDSGAALMPDDYLPGSFFTKGKPSVYWLNPQERGEGLNLADFGASKYGPAFTIETGALIHERA